MSRQNSFESFGLQVNRDGQFINWTIVKLQNGQWVLKQPGDKVPEDVEVNTPVRYFREKAEAEEAFSSKKKLLFETYGGDASPVDGRAFLGILSRYKCYEVLENDWDTILGIDDLKPWMRNLIEFFRDAPNYPKMFQDFRYLVPAQIDMYQVTGIINKVLGALGFRLLKIDKPFTGSSHDSKSRYQLFYAIPT